MKQKKEKYISLLMLPIAFAVCIALWYAMPDYDSTRVSGQSGLWDLRGFDLSGTNAYLVGPVEFIPNALLTPEEFAARANEIQTGYPQNVSEYATSRMRVLVPDGIYTLHARSIDYSERLYINGLWILDVGSPGETKETTIPDTGKIALTVQPVDGVIEIVQQGANFVHREGGGHARWYVGSPDLMRVALGGEFKTNMLLGCFLALSLVHIMLFFLLRGYWANLYFSLFCLTWFLRCGVTDLRVFSVLFPWMSWYTKFRIEYMAIPVTAALLVFLLDSLFPSVLQKWFRRAMAGVSAVFAVEFLFTDTLFMSHALLWCEGLYGLSALYIVARFLMKLRKISREQGVFLTGAALFIFATVHDMFNYNGFPFLIRGDMSQLSMLVFAFFNAAAIFIATMRGVENAKLEEQRLASENAALDRVNRLRGDLMATVSHEMRTPLAVMSVYAQLATETLRESGVDAQTTADLEKISSEAKRLAEMASGFLALAKEQENQKTHSLIAIGPLIEQIARLCAPTLDKNKNRLALHIAGDLPLVMANAGECSQLMWNLLVNAARHTQNGEVTVSAGMADGKLAVTVADTGEGMAADLLPHVFERRREGGDTGHGIGLAICKEIVDAHGGEIIIESAQSKGTAVTFTLPVYTGEKEHGE